MLVITFDYLIWVDLHWLYYFLEVGHDYNQCRQMLNIKAIKVSLLVTKLPVMSNYIQFIYFGRKKRVFVFLHFMTNNWNLLHFPFQRKFVHLTELKTARDLFALRIYPCLCSFHWKRQFLNSQFENWRISFKTFEWVRS